MSANSTGQLDHLNSNQAPLRWVGLILASLGVFWLASCQPPATVTSPVNPTIAPSATAPPVPTAVATKPVNATLPPSPTASLPATAIVPRQPLAITSLAPAEVGRYEVVELDIQTDIVTTNPFDPQELDIRVVFSAPSGKETEVGAFWYQAYDASGHIPSGKPGWKARFTPTETGEWSAVARIPARGIESAGAHFRVVESSQHGFVRVNPVNPRYFAFDDGSFFFPIGMNIAWWSGAGDALDDYTRWMDAFSSHGGNAIRVWMAEWSFGIEWNDTPLGNYNNRLRQAWLLDQIFRLAHERDMYVMLVLLNCADFNDWQTNGWNGNPYNVTRGGPLAKPELFITDPTARLLLKRRLNYIVNRWGYSSNLLAWEWWNEVNLAPFSDKKLIPWLQEMTATLREKDVNQHLVTNSYAIRDLSPIWALPEMDIIQKHEYATQVRSTKKDMAERVAADLSRLARSAPVKPILLGEFGYGNEGTGNDVDRTGIHLHNGIWATTFAGYAGSGMYWYWDVYVEPYHAWSHFQGLKSFLEGVDLSRYKPFSPLEIHGPGGTASQAAGLGLRGEDILVWLRSDAYTVQANIAAWKEAGSPLGLAYFPPKVTGQVLTLRDMEDGQYTIQWYDPQLSQWMEPVEITAHWRKLSILIPDFSRDLAARIIHK